MASEPPPSATFFSLHARAATWMSISQNRSAGGPLCLWQKETGDMSHLSSARRRLLKLLRYYLGVRLLDILDQIQADIDRGRYTDNHLRALRVCIELAKDHDILDGDIKECIDSSLARTRQ
jgi:hypothetical protein